jgi:hypothetical protein
LGWSRGSHWLGWIAARAAERVPWQPYAGTTSSITSGTTQRGVSSKVPVVLTKTTGDAATVEPVAPCAPADTAASQSPRSSTTAAQLALLYSSPLACQEASAHRSLTGGGSEAFSPPAVPSGAMAWQCPGVPHRLQPAGDPAAAAPANDLNPYLYN